MNRLKYLALAALVAFAACDEGDGVGVDDPISGTITGTVTAEGQGVSGIQVTLAGPSSQSATTGANGSYTFNNVPGGAYQVSISNIPSDFVFGQTSQSVVITTDGQTAQASFAGQIVRTASISGQVTASGEVVSGVTVTLSGDDTGTKQTNANGEYSFTGLRSGSYTVSITNPNEDVYTFSVTEQSVTLTAGESEVVNFAGTREGGGDGTGEQASVVIQGITGFAGGSIPTNALAGTVIARANVDEGDQEVTRIEFKIGDETVCTQTFGAAAVDGQQSGDNFTVDCTINTAAFDTETGVPNFLNGPTTLTVAIETAAGATRTATIDIGLANVDMFFATDITPESTAISPATGNNWWGGDVTATVVPVMYSGRTAARATVNFAGGTETDTDPSDGFIFTFQTSTAAAADFIGNTEAMNQAMTISGVTESGANFGAGTLTVQNYDDVAPSFAATATGATGNLPMSRWVNDPFTFGGVNAADGGVGDVSFSFRAGTSAATLEPVETGGDLDPSLTNDTYIVAVTTVDGLGNARTVYINGTVAGSNAAGATLIGVDVVDPIIDDVSGLEDGDIINGGTTFTIELEADDRSGFNDPIRIYIERFRPTSTTCVLEDTAGECDATNLGTGTGLFHTVDYTTDATPSALGTNAYYRPHFWAVDQANNSSDTWVITHIRDNQPPAVGGIGFGSVLEAGTSEDFTAPISDDLDIDMAELYLGYGMNFILFAEENVGGFGPDDGFVTSQTLSATVNPFVGWIEQGTTGVFADPDNARVDVFDFANNTGTVTTPITATIDAPAKVSYGAAARGPSGQIQLATFDTDDDPICGDATCTTNPSSTTARLVIQGASGELVNHFNQVYFYTELDVAGSMRWQRVGQASVAISDDGVNRFYTHTGTLSGSDFDAYAGGVSEAHTVAVLAIASDGTAIWLTAPISVNDD